MTIGNDPRGHAVVVCADRAWLPYALYVASGVASIAPKRAFDIIIASAEEIEIPEWFQALGITSLTVASSARDLQKFNGGAKHLPPSAYLRLLLPEQLKADYKRVLYMDTDIRVLGGDLDRLFHADLGGHPVGAVRDVSQWTDMTRPVFEFEANHLGGEKYLNSGVLLMDLDQWVADAVTMRTLDKVQSDLVRYTADQGVLNMALMGEWAELHPAWNWHLTRSEHLLITLNGPNFVHFAGLEKPWATDGGQLVHDRQNISDVSRFLVTHFPGFACTIPEPSALRQRDRSWGFRLIESAWMQWRLRAFLSRFDDPYHVLI